MFRRLFAIETAAIQTRFNEASGCHDQTEHGMGESLRDLARSAATPSCYGMWSARTAV